MLRFALLLVLMAGFCGSADAQWLRSKRNASVSSACPNGECPVQAAQVQSAPEVRGHWSYPGTIDSHLESVHGKSTAGMTRQQKLDYHDSLHEGTAGASAYQSVGYYCVGYGSSGRSYGSAGYGSSGRSYGSAGYGSSGRSYGSAGYGSSGYKASYGSSGYRASYGSSGGGGFVVGGRDKDGLVITSISPPGKPVFSSPVPTAAPKATCSCGEKCQCNAGGGKCPCSDDLTSWGRPNLDFAIEPTKQMYVRKQDVESMPAI